MRDIQQIAFDVIADASKRLSPPTHERIRQMARQLKNLRIDEVSSVDRGAGEGVKVLLMKRDLSGDDDLRVDNLVIDFSKIRAAMKPDGIAKLDEAIVLLRKSIASIDADESVTDKKAAKAESINQFIEHIAGLAPVKKEDDMTPAEIAKVVADEVAKVAGPLTASIAKLTFERDFALMPAAHQEFAKAMSDDDKKKFLAKKPEERDADCKKAVEAAAGLDGDPVFKAVKDENIELKKRLTALEDDRTLDICKRDAKELGMDGDDAGAILMKARQGDSAALAKVEAHIKAVKKQRDEIAETGKVFSEFGVKGGTAGSAYDELMAKAEELRKSDPKLTREQAFDKVYNDPANLAIKSRHTTEELKKRQAA